MANITKKKRLTEEGKEKLVKLLRESIAFKAEMLRAMCLTSYEYRYNVEALDILSLYGAGFSASHAAKAVDWFPKWFDDKQLPELGATYEDYLCLIAIAALPKEKAFKLYERFIKEHSGHWNPWELYVEAQVLRGVRERHDPSALKFDGKVKFRKNQILIKPTAAPEKMLLKNGEYHVKLIEKEKG